MSSANQISVYKSLGGIQCQGKGKSLVVIRQELLNANINVFGNGVKGDDGVARITVCGAPTGEIGIFMINKQDFKKARTLGFTQYTSFDE